MAAMAYRMWPVPTAGSSFGSTHRKTSRPERFSLCRRPTGEMVGASDSPASFCSAMVPECARKRRFGGNETATGNRKASFFTAPAGSEIIVPHDSEAGREVDVSYLFFIGYEKSHHRGCLSEKSSRQRRPGFRLNKRNIRAVDQSVDCDVFAKVRRSHRLT